MNELVQIRDSQVITTSRQVAEHFDKAHKTVLRSIHSLTSAQNCANVSEVKNMFFETTESDTYGRQQKIYYMNRDGFSLLVMGFTGEKALEWKIKYINAFNEMEKELQNSSPELPNFNNPAIAARAWADQYEARLLAEKTVEENKPKVVLADAISASETDIPIGTLAKILNQNGVNIGRNRLFEWLRDNGYLIKMRKGWNQPKQIYINMGLFRVTETVKDRGYGYSPIVYVVTYVTGKGQEYFVNKFLGKKELKVVG